MTNARLTAIFVEFQLPKDVMRMVSECLTDRDSKELDHERASLRGTERGGECGGYDQDWVVSAFTYHRRYRLTRFGELETGVQFVWVNVGLMA